MSRETKEITTPSGNKVTLHTYITAGEQRKIQALFMSHLHIERMPDKDEKNVGKLEGMTGTVMLEAQELALKFMVVAVDGNTVEPDQAVLNMRPADCDFVLAEINAITEGEKKGTPELQKPTSPPKD
jgi:hypothetical protein